MNTKIKKLAELKIQYLENESKKTENTNIKRTCKEQIEIIKEMVLSENTWAILVVCSHLIKNNK